MNYAEHRCEKIIEMENFRKKAGDVTQRRFCYIFMNGIWCYSDGFLISSNKSNICHFCGQRLVFNQVVIE
jgi:hypothetical protein